MFSKNRNIKHKDGYDSYCKICHSEMSKKWKKQNRKIYLATKKRYYWINREKISEQKKKWYNLNREKVLKDSRLYKSLHREKLRLAQREYVKKNREMVYESNRLRHNKRILKDKGYRIRYNLGSRLYKFVKKRIINIKIIKIIGCSMDFLISYLESKFQNDMSWENYGKKGWHIDHIIPCAAFDLTKLKEQKKCFRYTNLQPLWAKENLSKNDKMPNGERARNLCG